NPIKTACTRRPTVIVFIFKAVIHWFFGLSVKRWFEPADDGNRNFFRFRPVQISYITRMLVLLVIIISSLASWKPKGPQPAAYGHLQTLADLIHEWPEGEDLFWGHKSKDKNRICHAGASEKGLGGIKMDRMYS
ncbi:hypothetical protein K432DRAFT_309055, partial [Lepidopterella palustris CBS 459.81]